MIEGQLNAETVEICPTASGDIQLVARATWIRVAGGGFGFEASYRRPVRVVSTDGATALAIRDHVMIARGLALVAGLWLTIWRLMR